MEDKADLLQHLTMPLKHGQEITIYFPPTSMNTAEESWGSYTMPNMQSQLRKRDARRPVHEAPLEADATSSLQPVQSSSSSFPIMTFANNDTTPLPGILPQCFTSQSACESATRNCTGHGQCHKKYTDKSASSNSRYKDCYTCQCSASVQQLGDGKTKTTYWGGPGCQKKDVSVEFWIIALFTVGLVSLVSFAVGSVWSMGGEELPSVIGAGVSGPVKR